MTGEEGWGFAMKLEQELTRDGRAVGIFRYGRRYRMQHTGLSAECVVCDHGKRHAVHATADRYRQRTDVLNYGLQTVQT